MTNGSPCDGDLFGAAEALGVPPDEVLDFSGVCGACEPPEAVRLALAESLRRPDVPADPSARELRRRAAEAYGVAPEQLLVSGGPAEFIYAVPRALRPRRAIILAPCPHDYWRACDYIRVEADGLLASEAREFVPDLSEVGERLSGVDMLFLGNPNSPTGAALPADAVRSMAERFPSVTMIVDERFGGLAPEAEGISMLGRPLPANVILLRSLTCLYAMAGLPAGCMIASAELCDAVGRVREPGSFSAPALSAAEALLEDADGRGANRGPLITERERVREALARLPGLRVFQSQANFLLLKSTKPGLTSATLCERLLSRKILARNAAGFRGLDGRFLRICIRRLNENDLLLDAMRDALDNPKWK